MGRDGRASMTLQESVRYSRLLLEGALEIDGFHLHDIIFGFHALQGKNDPTDVILCNCYAKEASVSLQYDNMHTDGSQKQLSYSDCSVLSGPPAVISSLEAG